jgi:hypothetical protein
MSDRPEWKDEIDEFIDWCSNGENIVPGREYYFREALKRNIYSSAMYSLTLKWQEEVRDEVSVIQ